MENNKQDRYLSGLNERILQAVKKVGGQKKLSKMTGISESQIYRYMTGAGQPTVSKLVEISIASGFSVQWLATGQEHDLSNVDEAFCQLAEDHVVVPCYGKEDLTGAEPVNLARARQSVAFPKNWIPGQAVPSQLIFVGVVGDSMEPTLSQGDIALVDRSVATVTEDGLYVIQINQGVMVKRLQKTPHGKIQVTNDNKAYTSYTLEKEDAEKNLHIIGFVIWTGRKV